MKFLADENVSRTLVIQLRKAGFDVKDIKEKQLYGISDEDVLKIAVKERRTVITHDKDFLDFFNKPILHSGIILLRFSNQTPQNIAQRFIPLLRSKMSRKFRNAIVIVSDNRVEIITH
ncbi:MAG: DUF5615 family PIN-like protein [Candidatus Micrarchaeota archaeon]|nr:DUF5615 family PIN-like protein [Candidatus Micrarchaeota archaeon]